MVQGFYAAAAGMVAQMAAQEVVAHNLANAATPGYRHRNIVTSSFPAVLSAAQTSSAPAASSGPSVDFRPGSLQRTDRSSDLALQGDGWFTLQTPAGLRYTRDGRFTVTADHRLVSLDGSVVMGCQGPIVLPGSDFSVDSRGQVFSEGRLVDQLFLAQFDGPSQLQVTGPAQFGARVAPRQSATAEVLSGYLEQPNFAPVTELVQMISLYRLYEANQRALQMQDRTVDVLVNKVAS